MKDVPNPDRELDRDVEGCARAHQRLLADLADLDDDQARSASLLPGWTVGHVLTHLARHAEALVGLLDAADRGETADLYPGGMAQRVAAIDEGAGRSARELVADLRTMIYALEHRWATLSNTGWDGAGRTFAGEVPIRDMPMRRWREVEVHRSDLGLGATPADWSPEYVRPELERMTMAWAARRPMGLTNLPERALALAPHDRLAWLLGRLEVDGLDPAGIY